MEFVETFSYVIRYKQGKEHVVADALSRSYVIHGNIFYLVDHGNMIGRLFMMGTRIGIVCLRMRGPS